MSEGQNMPPGTRVWVPVLSRFGTVIEGGPRWGDPGLGWFPVRLDNGDLLDCLACAVWPVPVGPERPAAFFSHEIGRA